MKLNQIVRWQKCSGNWGDEKRSVYVEANDARLGKGQRLGCGECGADARLVPGNGRVTVEIDRQPQRCVQRVGPPANTWAVRVNEKIYQMWVENQDSRLPPKPIQLVYGGDFFGEFWPKDFHGDRLHSALKKMVIFYLSWLNECGFLPGGHTEWEAETHDGHTGSGGPAMYGVAIHVLTAQEVIVFALYHAGDHIGQTSPLPPDIASGDRRFSDEDLTLAMGL